eukprot:6222835-Amphidinium_carterae.1
MFHGVQVARRSRSLSSFASPARASMHGPICILNTLSNCDFALYLAILHCSALHQSSMGYLHNQVTHPAPKTGTPRKQSCGHTKRNGYSSACKAAANKRR